MVITHREVDPRPLPLIARAGRLKTAMKRRGLTAWSLHLWTGISHTTIGHYLAGDRDMHLDDIRKIADVLRVSGSWIAWGE